MKNSICRGLIIVSLITGISACGGLHPKSNDEGIIIYDVTFPYAQQDPLLNLYPDEMVMEFKNDKVRMDLNSLGNFISTTFIIDHKQKQFVQLLKAMQDYSCVALDENGVEDMVNYFPEVVLHETTETEMVAGIKCKKTIASFVIDSVPEIVLYHTQEIALKNPNWCTQFDALEGVLMGYEVEQYGMRMKLHARSISFEPVDESRFDVPDYPKVEFSEMRQKLGSIIGALSN